MNRDDEDPRFVLKATSPRMRKSLLARPRLSIEGVEFGDKSVIAVHAPGGFGKSSLLAQWRREWLRRGASVAWLTLDENDDDDRFVRGLCVTMRMTTGHSAFDQRVGIPVQRAEHAHQALTEWLSHVASMGSDTLLILDDASTMPAPTVRGSLTYLVRNAPSNLKVVTASRRPLDLPVSELLSSGQFAAVTAERLRFRFDETSAVLQGQFGPRISADRCGQLHELTEGWPLGLQLAISAIERSTDPDRAVDELPDCPADIERYFVECLTARLPAELNDFLTSISILDAMTADLCQAVTGRVDAAELLATLCHATPIITEGLGSDWVRIHRLARAYLRARFEARPACEQRELFGRAAHWLAEHRFLEEAARHARCAGLDALADDLAERGMHEMMIHGRYGQVLGWVERLADRDVRRRPRVRLAAGWALALSERHDEAAEMVKPVLACAGTDPADRCEAAAIAAAAAYFSDDLDRSATILAPWADRDTEAAPHVQSAVANHLGAFAVLRGEPEQGRQLLTRRSSPAELGVSGWFDFYMGSSYLWEGKASLAEPLLRGPLERAELDIGRRSSLACMLAAALAAVLWERDRTDEAVVLLTHRLDVLERSGSPDAIILGYVTAARGAALQGQAGRALDLLEELCGQGEARGIARFVVAGLAEQIRLHALQGRSATCAMLARRLDAAVPPWVGQGTGLLAPLMQLQVAMARAFARLGQRDWAGLRLVLADAEEIAERLHRGRDRIQLMLMRALAMQRLGDDGLALLEQATSLARACGLGRMLADTHPDLADWAQTLPRAHGRPDALHAAEPPEMPAPGPASGSRSRIVPSRLLTQREGHILQLLERGLTNKEIALGMGVTCETIKWHLKNLFGKLNVGTRKHAVHRARMLGIFE